MQLPPLWDPKRFHLIDDPIDLVRRDTQVRLEREKFLLSRHVSCSSSSLISSENNLCNFPHRPPLYTQFTRHDLICEQTTRKISIKHVKILIV